MQKKSIYKEELINLIESNRKKDLHIHTCFSDGELTPQQVVDRWAKEDYEVISVTDHDGIRGSEIAVDYASDKEIICIPGIEFDSVDSLAKDMHILGYGIDFNNKQLRKELRTVREWRDRRNRKLLKVLQALGYDIDWEDVIANSNGEYIGKPMFAMALFYKRYVKKPVDAFPEIFRKYEEIRSIKKEVLSSERVIEIIHNAGGLAVMAHPIEQRKINEGFAEFNQRLNIVLNKFLEYEIDGIECYHPSASKKQSEMLRKFAEENGLIVTRGSDFHVDNLNRNFSRYHTE
ncbi:MAG TPA: PHP domain-containing protein [Mogibacterium sp.]|nr:PHP domain-containing protein [Mogibacterium sp.]